MSALPEGLRWRSAPFDQLSAGKFHDIARLRSEVFIVEQQCAYQDLDGRDAEPGTRHFWVEADGASPLADVCATLRLLREPHAGRIGRVCTDQAWRGHRLAAALMEAAIAAHESHLPHQPLVLDAQSHLSDWYARFGFTPHGEAFLEDNIPHTPMVRTPS